MERESLSLLCDPDTRYAFELEGSTLRNTATGRVYPVRNGVPLFVSTLTGSNLKNQLKYDRLAPSYDLAENLSLLFGRTSEFRHEFLRELELFPGARVLEVGVGTGANLAYLPANIEFFGVDISWGMLRRCQKKAKKLGRNAHLFQGEACHLPFCAEAFDCVFHVGGFSTFNEPARALKEMIWVSRPGTKILIVDEIAKGADGRRNGSKPGEALMDPIRMVPEEMQETMIREIANGRLYCLTFRKPGLGTKARV